MRFLIVVFESPTAPTVGLFIFKAESMRTAYDAARGAPGRHRQASPDHCCNPSKTKLSRQKPPVAGDHAPGLHKPLNTRRRAGLSLLRPNQRDPGARSIARPSKAGNNPALCCPDFPLLRVGSPSEPSRAASVGHALSDARFFAGLHMALNRPRGRLVANSRPRLAIRGKRRRLVNSIWDYRAGPEGLEPLPPGDTAMSHVST